MNYYDIEKIYDEMEQYLIDNIKRNLTSDLTSFHLKEEKEYGFDWEAWQSIKLKELKRYRNQNKNILKKRLNNIDKDVRDVLRAEYLQGKKNAHKGFILALKKGFKSPVKVQDSFFKIYDRKLDALIKAVNNDFKKANQAVLRMTNDTYRQIIFEASMYNNTGVMTGEAAIRKAIGNFEKRGINSITYSNGSRHRISEYTRMAIRTASTRAYLQGEGEFRKKIGETLVIMSKHGTACKLCQPWEGRVLIDDVYSGGTKKDGKYPLLSDAMKQGLYHPNCRHGLGTYYKELGNKTSNEIIEKVEEQTQGIVKQPDKFVPAKNVKEVESRMKNLLGANNIKLNNMNMELANEYLEGMEMFLNEYPMMKDYTMSINTKIKPREAAHYGITFKRENASARITGTELSLRNPKDYKKFLESIKYGIEKRVMYKGNTSISTMVHELTHGLEFKAGSILKGTYKDGTFVDAKIMHGESVYTPLANNIIKEAKMELFGKEVGRDIYDGTKYLGSYAYTNNAEMLAQCISYEMTVGTEPFSAKVKEIFDRKIKEIFK